VRPAIVSLPRDIRALKNDVCWPVVTNNEGDVTLHSVRQSPEFPNVNPAHPIFGDNYGRTGFPLALAQAIPPYRRFRLRPPLKWTELPHQTPAGSPVKSRPVQLDGKFRCRFRADIHVQPF